MSRRHQGMKAGIARRIVIAGAIPLAVAVGCSSTTDHAADTATPNTAAGQSNSPQTPGHPAPGHPGPEATAPTEGAQSPAAGNPGDGITGPRAITSSPVQPGVTTPAADQDRLGHQPRPVQPGVTTTPNPLAPQVQPQPQSDYPIPANYRPIPNRDVAPAVDLGALHAPAPVTPVAPIAPPPRTVRIGDFTAPAPDQLPDPALDTVNGVAANTEAALATGLNSIGVNPSRSDKIAAGTLGGGIIGAGLGAAAAGIPVALAGGIAGGLVGAAVGTAIGFGLGTISATVLPWTAPIDIPGGMAGGALIGAAVGAAAGAAAVGLPAAAVGGALGGAASGSAGFFLGGAL